MKKSEKPITRRDNRDIRLYRMENNAGMRVEFLNYGGCVTSIVAPSIDGTPVDVVSGYHDYTKYFTNPYYFGALIGRVANRIKNAEFFIDGKPFRVDVNNADCHTLHGGKRSFSNYVWDVAETDTGYTLYGEFTEDRDGFPGNLSGAVDYELTEQNDFRISYRFKADAPTIINATSHPYFNLNGENSGDIYGHALKIRADYYLPTDGDFIPDGSILPVQNTPFDFREFRRIGARINDDHPMISRANGYDLCFALQSGQETAAEALGDKSRILLRVRTDQPGVQLFTANGVGGDMSKSPDRRYGNHDFFCLETQGFPGAERFRHFPSIMLNPGEEYKQYCHYAFSILPPNREDPAL